jgi:hypothetical protein
VSASHGNSETMWILLALLIAALLIWRASGNGGRELRRQQEARKRQQAAEEAEYQEVKSMWDTAERSALGPFETSLLLHPGELVGFAAAANRIVTHKVGHKMDRISSRSGATTGQSQSQSNSKSAFGGFAAKGIFVGSSRGSSSGVGQHETQHTSSGSGHTYSQDDIRTEIVDHGILVMTNQRVVFQGDNATIEILMEKVIGFHFKDGTLLVIDYAKRLNGECYAVPNPLAMKIAVTSTLHEPGFEVPPKPEILKRRLPPGEGGATL